MAKVPIKKLAESARLPQRATKFAAGYDLYTTDEYELQPGERHLYKTNLAMAIPVGMYGRIAPRSGLAFNHGIDVLAGVIDADYRQDVGVILINTGKSPWKPERDKEGKLKAIAQIIFEYYNDLAIEEYTELPEPDSNRTGGFGSTDGKDKPNGNKPNKPDKTDSPNTGGPPSLKDLYEKSGGIQTPTPYSKRIKGEYP